MALWGLFTKFTLLHQDSVFRAFSGTRESPGSMSEKAYIPALQREDVLELTVKSVSYRQPYHMLENMSQVRTCETRKIGIHMFHTFFNH